MRAQLLGQVVRATARHRSPPLITVTRGQTSVAHVSNKRACDPRATARHGSPLLITATRGQTSIAHVSNKRTFDPKHQGLALAVLLASAGSGLAFADARNPSLSASISEDDSLSVLSRKEPQTGVQFPLALSESESLHGTGVRLMGGLVRVYAIGLYVDQEAARLALSDWTGFSESDILSSDALWDAVCDPNASFRRTFRMVVVREVGSKHMRDGFDRGLAPRVIAASKKDLFMSVGTMKVGSDARITVDNASVSLTIDGRWLGEVKNPQLAWAMADMFLGEKAVAPTLRKSSAKGLEKLLKE